MKRTGLVRPWCGAGCSPLDVMGRLTEWDRRQMCSLVIGGVDGQGVLPGVEASGLEGAAGGHRFP